MALQDDILPQSRGRPVTMGSPTLQPAGCQHAFPVLDSFPHVHHTGRSTDITKQSQDVTPLQINDEFSLRIQ